MVSKIGGDISRFHPSYRHRRKVQNELSEQAVLLETHVAAVHMMAVEGWCGHYNAEVKVIKTAIGDRQKKAQALLTKHVQEL